MYKWYSQAKWSRLQSLLKRQLWVFMRVLKGWDLIYMRFKRHLKKLKKHLRHCFVHAMPFMIKGLVRRMRLNISISLQSVCYKHFLLRSALFHNKFCLLSYSLMFRWKANGLAKCKDKSHSLTLSTTLALQCSLINNKNCLLWKI